VAFSAPRSATAPADDLMYQHLRCRYPDDAREPVDDQQQHGLPQRHRVGQKHDAPAHRYADEQQHADLNQAADIEAIRQPPLNPANSRNGTQCDMTAKAAQRRRMKLLEHHPVADDVLDVVGHHRRGGGEEKDPKITVGKRGKCARLGGAGAGARLSGFNSMASR
jgi:hypothetical protein